MCSIFHFIHLFILFIHPFIYYLTTVRTWVPSFISYILLIIGPRFKHGFHLSFHSFIYYLTTVQTWVPSFISFILLIIGPRFKHVFHLSFHSFCSLAKVHSFVHSFLHLGYPGGTLVSKLWLMHNDVIAGLWTSPHLLLDGES